MNDEAHFHLDGYVNKRKARLLASENPKVLHQRPLHAAKVTVCCGITSFRIVGPYSFEDANCNAMSINGD